MTIDTTALRAVAVVFTDDGPPWECTGSRAEKDGLVMLSSYDDDAVRLAVAAVNALVPLCDEVERLRAECESLRREADLAHAAACSAAGDGVRT